MSLEWIKPLLKDFVNRNSNVYNVEWDPCFSEPLCFDPFAKSYDNRKLVAHYFLMVAAITESRLVGRAENARALMTYLHKILDVDLFGVVDTDIFEKLLGEVPFGSDLGKEKEEIPRLLASVNRFVQKIARNDLIEYARGFSYPKDMVLDIGFNVERMAEEFTYKSWLYMEWMTRSHPELRVFDNFSPCDLFVPLTSYIIAVASCLSLIPTEVEWEHEVEVLHQAYEQVTQFAKELFPEDPCKVSYPMYLLGRWIRGKQPSLKLLQRYLKFFAGIYEVTHTIPVVYDVASREMSSFEANVANELRKIHIVFSYESHRFNLAKGLTYLPDFVLPNCRINGKIVLLEPHGIWTRPIFRHLKVGGKRISCRALPSKLDESEVYFTEKMRLFRKMYGRDYHVVLLVPLEVFDRVKADYPYSYDEVYVGTDIPKLLYELKHSRG